MTDIAIAWEPLVEGVSWTSPMLFGFQMNRGALVSHLGLPQFIDLVSDGIGLFDAWALRFPCGLEITLWLLHEQAHEQVDRTAETIDESDETANFQVHAIDRDFDHIRFHLPLTMSNVSKCFPDQTAEAPRHWQLVRQDEHGTRCVMTTFTSRCEAEATLAYFERRGHKQTYWVEGPSFQLQ